MLGQRILNKDSKKMILEFFYVFILGQFLIGVLCGCVIDLYKTQFLKGYFVLCFSIIVSLSYLVFSHVYTWFRIIKLMDKDNVIIYKILFYLYVLVCVAWNSMYRGSPISSSPLMALGENFFIIIKEVL